MCVCVCVCVREREREREMRREGEGIMEGDIKRGGSEREVQRERDMGMGVER